MSTTAIRSSESLTIVPASPRQCVNRRLSHCRVSWGPRRSNNSHHFRRSAGRDSIRCRAGSKLGTFPASTRAIFEANRFEGTRVTDRGGTRQSHMDFGTIPSYFDRSTADWETGTKIQNRQHVCKEFQVQAAGLTGTDILTMGV